MAKHAVFWLNAFQQLNGIGSNWSLQSIIVGTNINYSRHCKYQFGEFVQMHKEHDNSMMHQTIGALVLQPTGNAQGSFYFFSLSTGQVITQSHAMPLAMPDNMIEQVHRIAWCQKANVGLIFADRAQHVVEEGNNKEDAEDIDDDSYSKDGSSHVSEVEWEDYDHEGSNVVDHT